MALNIIQRLFNMFFMSQISAVSQGKNLTVLFMALSFFFLS